MGRRALDPAVELAGNPWLLAGDFNATFDQAPFRDLVDRGYRDAGETAGKGLDATFPADGGLFPLPAPSFSQTKLEEVAPPSILVGWKEDSGVA